MDKRKERNKKAIIDALIENSHNWQYDMSISKLCALANVSRTSFYSYYEGIHSIVEELESIYLKPLINKSSNIRLSGPTKAAQTFTTNKKVWLFLLNNGNTKQILLNDMCGFLTDNMLRRMDHIPRDLLNFLTAGVSRVLMEEVIYLLQNNEKLTVEENARMLDISEQLSYIFMETYIKDYQSKHPNNSF